MSSEIITTTGRGIQEITAEIRVITGQARQYMAHTIIELGRRLTEAKALVPAGEWLGYLEKEVEYSESTAENYMRIFREYGDGQQNLFNPNSEALLNLPYTKLLRLLAVPAEERAEFAEEVNAQELSSRELEEAIRAREQAITERDRARKAAEDAEIRRREAADELDKVRQEDRSIAKELKEAREKAELAEGKAKAAQAKLEKAKAAADKAKKEAEDARAAKAQVPEDVMEQLRRDAEAKAAEAAQKQADSRVAEAQAKAEAAEKARAEAERKLEQAQKAQALGSQDAAAFKLVFQRVQTDFGELSGSLSKVMESDRELGEKFRAAVKALLKKLEEGIS